MQARIVVMLGIVIKTKNIRVFTASRDRFKIKAARAGVSMMDYIEGASKQFLPDDYFKKTIK